MTRVGVVLMLLIAASPLESQTQPVGPSQGAILFPVGVNSFSVSDLSISIFSDLAQTEYVVVNPGKTAECYLALECLPRSGSEPSAPASLDGVFLTCNENTVPVTYSSRVAMEEKLKVRLPSLEGSSVLFAKVVFHEGTNRLTTTYRLPALQGDDAIGILYRTVSLRNADKWGTCTPRFTVRYYPDYDLPFAIASGGDPARWVAHTDGRYGKSRSGAEFRLRNGYVELRTENAPLPERVQFSFPGAGSAAALDRFYNDDGDPLITSYFSLRNSLAGQEWNAALARVRKELAGFTKQQLRFMINFVYAMYGYEFRDPEVLREFQDHYWYVVDPLQRQDAIRFAEPDRVMVELLK